MMEHLEFYLFLLFLRRMCLAIARYIEGRPWYEEAKRLSK